MRDLTQTHERMLHTFLISRDRSSFAHLHHEDFYEAPVPGQQAAWHLHLTDAKNLRIRY